MHRNFIIKIPITLGSTQIALMKHSDLPAFATSSIGTPYPYETDQGDASGSQYERMCNILNYSLIFQYSFSDQKVRKN